MHIGKILDEPHPIGFGWAYAVIPATMVFFILTVLTPYGFSNLDPLERLLKALPFSIITGLAAPVNLLLIKTSFPKIIDESKWTIQHEFIYNLYDIALIGFWNSIYLYLINPPETSFTDLLVRIMSHTLMVGIIPMIALIGFKHNRALRQQLLRANRINEELPHKDEHLEPKKNEIAFYGENGKFEIKLPMSSILFLKSEGNYIEVFYSDDEGNEAKHLVRNRLKSTADLLPEDTFFHCHKSYVVHLIKIAKVEGNARNLNLMLTGTQQKIPVSRNKASELQSIINQQPG